MASLKLCIMIHVEDQQAWNQGGVGTTAAGIAAFASCIAQDVSPLGRARVSLQVGRRWLDENDPNGTAQSYDPAAGSVLSILVGPLKGNLWMHGHDAAADQAKSTYACVRSAYSRESGGLNPDDHVVGRSGGAASASYDVWDVAVNQLVPKLKAYNATTPLLDKMVPTSLRTYQETDDEIDKLYAHMGAPGPRHVDIATMRARTFYSNVASQWSYNDSVNTVGVAPALVGSLIVIPHPSHYEFPGMAERRTGDNQGKLTVDDMRAALTEVWSTYETTKYFSGAVPVWYAHVPPRYVQSAETWSMFADWVGSVNDIMNVTALPPKAEWLNMTSITWVTSAAYT